MQRNDRPLRVDHLVALVYKDSLERSAVKLVQIILNELCTVKKNLNFLPFIFCVMLRCESENKSPHIHLLFAA